MAKSNSNSQLAKAKSSRPYKSRSQRPCDFCRRRKTCCIIEGSIPCTPCIQFNQSKCTFNEGPMKRNNKLEKAQQLEKLRSEIDSKSPIIKRDNVSPKESISPLPMLGAAIDRIPRHAKSWPSTQQIQQKEVFPPQKSIPMDFIPILFSQSFTTKSSNNATSNSIKTNITSNPIATSTTTTTTNTIDTGLTTSLSSLSLHALDLVYNEKSDDVSGELSSILTSTAPVNVQRRQSLAQLSKLSNTIFSVISNTAVNPVNTGNPGINNTGFNELDLLTNSSVYSNNQFSPHRVESLTSIDTLSLYNYQLDTSPLMIQPMDLQRRFVDDEYQKLPPDPLFEEQFPIFQFSPESDVF